MSQAYGISRDEVTICGINGCNSSLTLPNLPAGSYAIFAKVNADRSSGSGGAQLATCTLTAGSDTDQANAELTDYATGNVSARQAMLPLQVLHTFDATGQAVLLCINSNIFYRFGKITAMRVGQVTQTVAP
jgi:hypothetical protein